MSVPYGNVRFISPIRPVADPVSEFFQSLRFLLCAAWQADGASAKGFRLVMEHRRRGLDVPGSVLATEHLGDVATRIIVDYLRMSLPGEIVIRETP